MTTDTALWSAIASEFVPDGALRDIYIQEVDREAWNRVLAVLRAVEGASFTVHGQPSALPDDVADAVRMHPDAAPLLRVPVEGIEYVVHFFVPDEIELDFLPSSVKGPEQAGALSRFISSLGRAARRDVLVCHENQPEAAIIRYLVREDQVRPAGGASDAAR